MFKKLIKTILNLPVKLFKRFINFFINLVKTVLEVPVTVIRFVKRSFSRIVNFFRKTFLELKQVEWLSRKDTLRFSFYVITFIVVGVITILLIDKMFLIIRNLIIR